MRLESVSSVSGEWMLFWYELTTALLCRIILLSVPDEGIAITLALVNTALETQLRTWFYMLYMTAGLKYNFDEGTSTEQDVKNAHWKFGRARVADACNDMVVEYVTAILGVYLVYSFSDPSGPIVFGADQTHSTSTLLKILAYQICPELIVDTYCTALEIKGGLMAQHTDYWLNFYSREGLVKSLLKVNWTPCIVCWVLLMAGNKPEGYNSM